MYDASAHERAFQKAMKFSMEGSEDRWKGALVDVT